MLGGDQGFVMNGVAGDFSGRSVSGARDVNGDGLDDILIGAHRADPNGTVPAMWYLGKAMGRGRTIHD